MTKIYDVIVVSTGLSGLQAIYDMRSGIRGAREVVESLGGEIIEMKL
jgi:hypothetical protein